jgi:hypothetical protein
MRGKLQSTCGGLAIVGALGAGALSGGGIAAAQPVHASHPHSATSDVRPAANAHTRSAHGPRHSNGHVPRHSNGHVPQHSKLAKTSGTVVPTSPPEQSLAERSLDVPAPPSPADVLTQAESDAVRLAELTYVTANQEIHELLKFPIDEFEALNAERETADPARQAEIDARIDALKEDVKRQLFIFQEYYQSATALLSQISHLIEMEAQR